MRGVGGPMDQRSLIEEVLNRIHTDTDRRVVRGLAKRSARGEQIWLSRLRR